MPEPHAHSDKHEAHRRLIARLRQHAEDVRRITAGLDETALAKRTVPDKWSLKELVCHLERVQQVFDGRIQAVLAQENPVIARYDPDGDVEFEKMVARPARIRWRHSSRAASILPGVWKNLVLPSGTAPAAIRNFHISTCICRWSTWGTTKRTTSTRCSNAAYRSERCHTSRRAAMRRFSFSPVPRRQLLVAQRHHWIHPGRPPRRKIACRQARAGYNYHHAAQRDRIVR